MDFFARVQELIENFKREKREIQQDTALSEQGKKEKIKARAAETLTICRGLLGEVEGSAREIQEQIEALRGQAPGQGKQEEADLLAEQKQINLLMSKLSAAGTENFLRVARGAAESEPGAFTQAFHQIKDQADRLFPSADPGAYDPWGNPGQEAGAGDQADQKKRAFTLAELDHLYSQAEKASLSPDQQQHKEKIEELESKLPDSLSDQARITRILKPLEDELVDPDLWGQEEPLDVAQLPSRSHLKRMAE